MCDFFWQRMENNTDQLGGDLSDIIRSSLNQADTQSPTDTWHFPTVDSDLMSFDQQTSTANDYIDQGDLFGMSDQLVVASNDVKNQGSNNIFSRVLQISPIKHSPISPRAIRPNSHDDRMVKTDHTAQISSSPRPPPVGTKRRKGLGKKVVCVPAPAAASSRSSGEVVPSDLWAWRKYGQKPIKGSPYPRGYYRCSSSKGCSARKQVERSRTDPNMLVITYTSDHNHPWPTQRNALAGSTRFQPSKSKIDTSASSSSSKKTSNITKDNQSEISNIDPKTINVKEEVILNEQIPMDNDYTFNQDLYNDPLISTCGHSDDFFADLAELESDPMSLIFTTPDDDEEDQKGSDKGLGVDPFVNMFDWGKGL